MSAVEEATKQRTFQRPSNSPTLLEHSSPGLVLTPDILRPSSSTETILCTPPPRRVGSSPRSSRSPRALSKHKKGKDKEDLFQEVTVYITPNIKEIFQQNPEKSLKKILPPICTPHGINFQRNCFFLFDYQRRKVDPSTKVKDVRGGTDGKVIYVVNLKDNQMAADWPEVFAGTTPENGRESKNVNTSKELHTLETSSESSSDDIDQEYLGTCSPSEKSDPDKLQTAVSLPFERIPFIDSIRNRQSSSDSGDNPIRKAQTAKEVTFHPQLRPSDKASSFLLKSPNQQNRTSRPFIGERSNHDSPPQTTETPTKSRRNPSQGTLESTPRSPKNNKGLLGLPSVPPRPKNAPPEVSMMWRRLRSEFPNVEEGNGVSPSVSMGGTPRIEGSDESSDDYNLHDYF